MGENNYIFGFDIGIGSTGVAVISDDGNLVYDGTHVFNKAEEASESRKIEVLEETYQEKNGEKINCLKLLMILMFYLNKKQVKMVIFATQ